VYHISGRGVNFIVARARAIVIHSDTMKRELGRLKSFRLEEGLLTRLERISREQERSLAWVIRKALTEFVERQGKQKKK
jgi:hypothetical protein